MEPFQHHIFVCTQEKPEGVPSCPCNGSWQVLQALERELAAQGLDNDVQLFYLRLPRPHRHLLPRRRVGSQNPAL